VQEALRIVQNSDAVILMQIVSKGQEATPAAKFSSEHMDSKFSSSGYAAKFISSGAEIQEIFINAVDPGREICEKAKEMDANLICMGLVGQDMTVADSLYGTYLR